MATIVSCPSDKVSLNNIFENKQYFVSKNDSMKARHKEPEPILLSRSVGYVKLLYLHNLKTRIINSSSFLME